MSDTARMALPVGTCVSDITRIHPLSMRLEPSGWNIAHAGTDRGGWGECSAEADRVKFALVP